MLPDHRAPLARRVGDSAERPDPLTIEVDGRPLAALPGESLAAALMAAGYRSTRITHGGAPRAPYCAMGVCFDCVVTVDGENAVRSCLRPVTAGMKVRTGHTS
ncbi:(2Fe-2S)-binding protein [Streptomyces sp. NPDC052077]|uniref:(2Fe-2S)-binding protein n=1 Tax=Streptomyces sp. NPDC052077 TaxID=3154757 RepID=UPI0034418BC7